MNDIEDLLASGAGALELGQWQRARRIFETALRSQDRPEAHDGLGLALWWLNDIQSSHEHRQEAFRGYRQRGDDRRAAIIAAWLAREQIFLSSNVNAMLGWFSRAERLLDGDQSSLEYAWYLIYRSSILDPPEEQERACATTFALARTYGDVDLEAFARAFQGSAIVSQGRVAEGMALLDEAMTMATSGEVRSYAAISEIYCVMLSACESVADVPRAEQWCRAAAAFARKHHSTFLAAYCRTIYGGILTATGQWDAAEAELTEAIRAFDAGHRGLRRHAAIKLADLMVLQGRTREAELMLSGYEDQEAAAVPLARLHLAQGDARLAAAVLDQILGKGDPQTGQESGQLLLVDVRLALADIEGAEAAARRLDALAARSGSDMHRAQAELALGRIGRWVGDAGASDHYRRALDHARRFDQSRVAGQARLEMAYLLQQSDWHGAVTWARAALATFTRIGATSDADEAAAVLHALGSPGHPLKRRSGTLTPRESEVLDLVIQGLTNRQIGERLSITTKTAEHHVGSILDKLGVQSRTEAAVLAARGDLIQTPD